jgi:long-subunit fatty acid transport protein
MRHADLPEESSSRFFGKAIDLKTYRAEAQAALAVNDAFSLGISAGLTRMDYASAVSLRALVPMDPAKPYDIVSNPAEALMETVVRQAGSATAFTYGIGLRYAITSRWTVGGSYQSGVKGRPGFAATIPSRVINLFHPSGYKTPLPPLGTEDKAQVVMDAIEAHPGGGRLALPSRIQVGVRNRFNQLMTWEVDFRYIGISSTKIPAQPWISTRSGDVSTLNRDYVFRDGMAYSGMIEISLGKVWVSRCGFSLEPALRSGEEVDAMLGGSRSAGFSIGFGYQVFGGELSAGYQFRQAQDKESNGLEGSWSDSGLRHTGTLTRVEGMGHLLSIGFRKSF